MTQSFGDPGSTTRTSTVVLNADVAGYTSQVGAAAQQTNQLASSVDSLTTRLSGLDKWASRKLFHIAAGDFAALGGATADAATFEKQLSTLSATAAVTNTSFKGLKSGIESAFTKFGVSRGDVIALTEALTNLGVTGERQIASLTQTFIKLGAATGESSVGLAQGLTQLSKLMGVSDAGQIGNMANSLLTVSKNAGVSATGVLNFAQSIAPMARQAGIGEAAVLGISSAFTKAGADGYVASNVFNSIVTDITQLSKTGSPELAKYANLLGLTASQFKNLPGQDQIAKVFGAIGKGGAQSLSFLNEQGYGTRQQSAITAVTQSGDLQRMIATATGAQGNQNNLNKGADAAFNNLADSLARLRNNFTELGTVIGTTFLKPLSLMTSATASATHGLTQLMKPFSSIIGGAAATGGVMAGLGGVAMNAAGIIGTVALGRMVTRGTHVASFGAGFGIGRGGVTNQAQQITADKFKNGEMTRLQEGMYKGGLGFARAFGPATPGGGAAGSGESDLRQWRTWRNMGLAAPFRVVQALNNGQGQMLRESTRSSWDRLRYRDAQPRMSMGERFNGFVASTARLAPLDVVGQESMRTARGMGNLGNAYINAGASQVGPIATRLLRYSGPRLATSIIAGATGVPLAGSIANKVRGSAPDTLGEASTNLNKSAHALGAAMAHPVQAFGALTTSAKETAVALKDVGIKAAGYGLGRTAQLAGNGIAAGTSMAWNATKSLASKAFTMPGMIALSAGTYMWHRNAESEHAGDVDKFLNPIQKYNDMLGTTTTNLANFNQTLVDGAKEGGVAKTMKDAANVTPTDVTTAPNKPKNGFWSDVKNNTTSGDRTAAFANALGALQISDPKQLQAAKEDMLAAGASKAQVQAALKLYMSKGGPDAGSGIGTGQNWDYLGTAIANSEGQGKDWKGGFTLGASTMSKSKSGGQMMGLMLSGIDAQSQTDTQQVSGTYARQRSLGSYAQGLAALANKSYHSNPGGRDASRKALADALHQITGGKTDDYEKWINSHASASTFEGNEQYVVQALGGTKQGQTWLKGLKTNGGTTDVRQISEKLIDLSNTTDGSSFNGLLRKRGGALGKFAANNASVQSAIGLNQASPGYVDKSTELLMDQAVKLAGGFSGAGAELEKFKSTISDTDSALYKQVAAAQQLADQQASFKQPFQTRQQNFTEAISQYQNASNAYYATPVENRGDKSYLNSKKQAYEDALASQQQYLQSMYQTAQQYGTQMTRQAQDETTQISRSWRDFREQQTYAQKDFNRSQERTEQDHATALKNQAAQTAQSIYDPFQRVQTKYTADAGTILDNLTTQNERMRKQRQELDQAHKMGLSTQAIQTLDLANPENAQQLDEMISTAMGDPKLIAKINQQVQQRVRNTRGLTQNPYSLAFTQSQNDYKKQMDRAEQDYKTATDRATHQHDVALADMATDYGLSIRRAGEDLTTAMTEVTGNFGSMYAKTMSQISASVQKFSPQAAAQMAKDIGGLVKKFPFLTGGDPSTYDPHKAAPYLPEGAPGYTPPATKAPTHAAASSHAAPGGKVRALAAGGLTYGPQLAMVSEWAPNAGELHVPLTQAGATYMADMYQSITKAVVQQLHTSGRGSFPTGGGGTGTYTYSDDHSTIFSGDIAIQAADLKDLLRQLDAKKRVSKLSRPTHH